MPFDFLDGWLEWSSALRSPRSLRLWSGIGILSAVLNRHVWFRANSRFPPLFPNLFIMLVAPPRVGKDMAINAAARFCRAANTQAQKQHGHPIIHFGGQGISPKGILDLLRDSEMSDKTTPKFHSLSFFIPELTTTMPEYDPHLIGILNELWNCNESYGEKIRGIEYVIDKPHVTMLLGNQPSTLFRVFPESVFQMGFTARVFFIYAKERVRNKVYYEPDEEKALDSTLESKLINHLVTLSQWSGQLKTTKALRQAMNDFDMDEPSPVPGTRFEHWNGGRGLNTQKLAMCIAASEGTKTVTLKHWERAVTYLFDAEKNMPAIFENVTTDRGFVEDLESIANLAKITPVVTQYKLLTHLSRTKSPMEAAIIIDQAIRAGILSQVYDEAGAPTKPARYSIRAPVENLPLLQ